jgi:hypothetical protein
MLASAGILFCGDARGYYRTLPLPSISKCSDRKSSVSWFKSIELSCTSALQRCKSSQTIAACAAYYQSFAFAAYPDFPDLAEIAERRVRELGGSNLALSGGPGARLVSRWLGWKVARRCQWARSWLLPHRTPSWDRHVARR